MKILQVAPAYYPAISIGGPIFSMLALAKLLNRHHVLDTLTTPLGLSNIDRAKVVYDDRGRSPCGSGRIVYKRYYGYPHFTFSPGTADWLNKEIRNYDLAIMHGVWNFPIIAAAHICQEQGVPFVLFPHGTLLPERVALRATAQKELLLDICLRRLLSKAARVVFTTEYEVQKTATAFGLHVRPFVVPNIVDASEFASLPPRGLFREQHGIAAATQVILFFGRIARVKGIDFAIRALARMRRHGRDVVLVIAGGDDEHHKADLQKLAADLRVEDGIIYTGMLNREQAKKAMVDSNVFVLSSLSENFGMAVVEAMLSGLPVVISENVGVAPDLAKAEAGMVVPLDPDAKALTEALSELLDDEPLSRSLAERGRRFAIDNYDEPAVQGRMEELVRVATTPEIR